MSNVKDVYQIKPINWPKFCNYILNW